MTFRPYGIRSPRTRWVCLTNVASMERSASRSRRTNFSRGNRGISVLVSARVARIERKPRFHAERFLVARSVDCGVASRLRSLLGLNIYCGIATRKIVFIEYTLSNRIRWAEQVSRIFWSQRVACRRIVGSFYGHEFSNSNCRDDPRAHIRASPAPSASKKFRADFEIRVSHSVFGAGVIRPISGSG